MAVVWFLISVMASVVYQTDARLVNRQVTRIALRPSSNSNLCVRVKGSSLELAPCENGGQIFDQVSVAGNGMLFRLSNTRSSNRDSTCVVSSFSNNNNINKDNDDTTNTTADDIEDDEFEGNSSRGSGTVITTTCNKRNKFQTWSFKRVRNGGVQVINSKTKRCITADTNSGAILITSKCNARNTNQIWNALTVKL